MSDYWLTHCDNCGKPEQDCRCNDEKRIAELTEQRDELLRAAKQCRHMLLTEANTIDALFRAETILLEAIAKAEKK